MRLLSPFVVCVPFHSLLPALFGVLEVGGSMFVGARVCAFLSVCALGCERVLGLVCLYSSCEVCVCCMLLLFS